MTCAKTELCIFDSALPQVVVESANFEEVFPLNSVEGANQRDIIFNIIGSTNEYLDLNDTMLYVQVMVTAENGDKIDDKADVTPSNYMFHTLFKDAILSLNNVRIEGGNGVYAHKALIETILNYGSDTKRTSLQSIGFAEPAARKEWIAKSKRFSMCGSLQLDFFDQPKYLIPGVNVNLRLNRTDSSFSLKSTGAKFNLDILDARLYVRRVKVEQSVMIGHQIGLSKQNAIYPFRQTQLTSVNLAVGSTSYYQDQIFSDGRLPKFILIAFQNGSQYTGSFTEDTGTYKNFNITSLSLTRNSDFREVYTQSFENDNYVTTYASSIIRNMGLLDKNLNNGITLEQFKSTYPFFTFVLAPDFDVNQTQLPKHGNIKIEVKFNAALERSAALLIYGVFDSEVQINKNGTIYV